MKNKAFFKDFSWYFIGSFLPLLIGFIKAPIFTRYFDKEAFGYLGIITITFSYFGMLLFSWIASCIWRYYHKYKDKRTLKELYTNLLFLFVIASVILFLITSIWYFIEKNTLSKQLIFYSFFQLIFNQLFLGYMVLVRLEGKARFYTIFHSIKSLLALVITLVLVFVFNKNISALVSGLAVVDFLAIAALVFINPSKISFSRHLIHKKVYKELLSYGSAGLIINVGLLVIASSDRYLIAWLSSIENVGIYDQVYKISQLSVWALITIYFNTINPYLLNTLDNKFESTEKLIRKYLYALFLYGIPLIVYLSLFSKDLATILLGKEFRSGYTIMPYVFIAAYLHGISNFYELRLKFSNQLKKLIRVVVFAAIFNMITTYIFVQNYGYKSAALTTTIAYACMLIIFHFYDQKIASFSKNTLIKLLKITLILMIQVSIYLFLKDNYYLSLYHKIMIALVFMLTYVLLLRKQFLTLKIPVND